MPAQTRKRLLVTGANGFIGRAVCSAAHQAGWQVRALVRRPTNCSVAEVAVVEDWCDEGALARALRDCQAVVHCAARAHVLQDTAVDPLSEFRKVNVEHTVRLAQMAVASGVERFIFLSSIGVNGAESGDTPFSSRDTPNPQSAYAVSKQEAETELQKITQATALKVVILRCPLVYGPGAPGNFASMVRLLTRGVPLPLGAVHNKRSLLGLDNLCSLIVCCLSHAQAPGGIFLACDGSDISTTELLHVLGAAMNSKSWLVPLPVPVLRHLFRWLGKAELSIKLLGNLQVDLSETTRNLQWIPPVSLYEGLRRAVASAGKSFL